MTFKQKIDKILKVNTLGITSVSGLEDFIGAGRQAINKFYNANRDPGRKTLKKIYGLPGLNLTWWETGTGDVFCNTSDEILTHEPNEPTMKPKIEVSEDQTGKEYMIKTLRETNDGLRADAAGYRQEIAELRKERDELKRQLTELLNKTASSNNVK